MNTVFSKIEYSILYFRSVQIRAVSVYEIRVTFICFLAT